MSKKQFVFRDLDNWRETVPPPIAALGSEQPLVKIGAAVVFSMLVAVVFTMMDQPSSATRGDRIDGSNGKQATTTVAAVSSRPAPAPAADVPQSPAAAKPAAPQAASPAAPFIQPPAPRAAQPPATVAAQPPAPFIQPPPPQPAAVRITHIPAQVVQPVAASMVQPPMEPITEPRAQEFAHFRSPQIASTAQPIAEPPQATVQAVLARVPMPRPAPARAVPTIFDRYAEREPPASAGGTSETTGETPAEPVTAAADREEAKPRPAIASAPGIPTDCLPAELQSVLAGLKARFGPITIVSTRPLHTPNHSAGSVREKLHLACKAVDIRTPKDAAAVMAYLRSRPEVGGVESYRNRVIHFDLKSGYAQAARSAAPAPLRLRQAASSTAR